MNWTSPAVLTRSEAAGGEDASPTDCGFQRAFVDFRSYVFGGWVLCSLGVPPPASCSLSSPSLPLPALLAGRRLTGLKDPVNLLRSNQSQQRRQTKVKTHSPFSLEMLHAHVAHYGLHSRVICQCLPPGVACEFWQTYLTLGFFSSVSHRSELFFLLLLTSRHARCATLKSGRHITLQLYFPCTAFLWLGHTWETAFPFFRAYN